MWALGRFHSPWRPEARSGKSSWVLPSERQLLFLIEVCEEFPRPPGLALANELTFTMWCCSRAPSLTGQ